MAFCIALTIENPRDEIDLKRSRREEKIEHTGIDLIELV